MPHGAACHAYGNGRFGGARHASGNCGRFRNMRPASFALVIALMALIGCSQKNIPSSSESSIPPPAMITLEMRMQAAAKLARHTLGDLEQRLAHPPPSQ